MKKIALNILMTLIFAGGIFAQETEKKFSLVTHWLPQAQFAGIYIAAGKGFFEKHGLKVEVKYSGIKTTAEKMLASGEADFASMFLSTAIRQRAEGVKLINIAQLSQRSALVFVAKKKSGISKPEDFNGKKIGIWRTGFEEIPKAFIKKFNLDVSIIPIQYSPTLFLLDGIDIITVMWYNEYHTIINSGVDEDELNTFFLSDYDLDVPEDGLYCLEKTYDKDPSAARALVQAVLEGWTYAFDHIEETLDLVLIKMKEANIPANRAHQRWMLNRIREIYFPEKEKIVLGKLSREDYDKTADILLHAKSIYKAPSFELFVRDLK